MKYKGWGHSHHHAQRPPVFLPYRPPVSTSRIRRQDRFRYNRRSAVREMTSAVREIAQPRRRSRRGSRARRARSSGYGRWVSGTGDHVLVCGELVDQHRAEHSTRLRAHVSVVFEEPDTGRGVRQRSIEPERRTPTARAATRRSRLPQPVGVLGALRRDAVLTARTKVNTRSVRTWQPQMRRPSGAASGKRWPGGCCAAWRTGPLGGTARSGPGLRPDPARLRAGRRRRRRRAHWRG